MTATTEWGTKMATVNVEHFMERSSALHILLMRAESVVVVCVCGLCFHRLNCRKKGEQ